MVSIRSGWRKAKQVRHVVTSIVSPMGPPLSARPPVPTEEERLDMVEQRRAAKDVRQASRGRQAAQGRMAEREKIQRWNADNERRERFKAKRLERLERASPEEKAVEEVIGQLAREKTLKAGKRLAIAMEECKAHYAKTPERWQALMRTQEWLRALLDDTNEHRKVLELLVKGKQKDAVMADIDITKFRKGRQIADQILGVAWRSVQSRRRMEERAAKMLEAETQGDAGSDVSGALAALNASQEPTALKALLYDQAPAPHGPDSDFPDITLPAMPPLDPTMPISAALDSLRAAVQALNAKAADLAAQSSAADGSPARKELQRLAQGHFHALASRTEERIEMLERLQRLAQEHKLVRERPAVFWRAVSAMGVVMADRRGLARLFGFGGNARDDARESVSGAMSGQMGTEESANSDEPSRVHADGEKESSDMADEKQQQDVR